MTALPSTTFARRLRLGTRASALARWQAEWVASGLAERGVQVDLVPITTAGDQDQSGSLRSIGGTGAFTKELQRALLDERIDLAVHSLKDLPTEPVDGVTLAAVPRRGPVADALVTTKADCVENLPQGAVVGTGSIRRRAQLWHLRSDFAMRDVRGNVDTRLQKLQARQYDALVLAEAGLRRLGLEKHIACVLPMSTMLPAPGQGALGIETRSNDGEARELVSWLNDPQTEVAARAERTVLSTLRVGCLAPVAAWARVEASGQLCLSAVVLSPDGASKLHVECEDAPFESERLGRRAAEDLLQQGAAELIGAVRESELE